MNQKEYTNRHTDRQTDTQNERYVGDSEKEKPIDRGTEKQKEIQTNRQRHRQIDRDTDKQTEIQKNRQRDRQKIDRQTKNRPKAKEPNLT